MGFFGNWNGTPAPAARSAGIRQIEEYFPAIGWAVADRHGDSGVEIRFNTPLGVRAVLVSASDRVVVFGAFSAARFAPDRLPEHLGYYLLVRNKDAGFGAWQASNVDGQVAFQAACMTTLGGLTAVHFKVIVEGLVREVAEVEAGLRSKGLI